MSLTITELVERAHTNAVNKGFWDKPRETGTLIALIHSEVTEALDADSCADFCEELSDIVIRVADLCGGKGINLEAACKDDLEFAFNSLKELEDGCKRREAATAWEAILAAASAENICSRLRSPSAPTVCRSLRRGWRSW